MATGSLKFFWDMVHAKGGEVARGVRGISAPVKEIVTPQGYTFDRRVLLPKKSGGVGVPVRLWDYTEQLAFSALLAQIVGGSGYAYLAWVVDRFSAGVPEAGARRRVNCVDLSCHAPFILTTNAARVNDTLADATGVTGGVPTILSDAGTETGQLVSMHAANDSTTADIEMDIWIRH